MLPAIDCEPYSFSPNAAHELDVLNHEPGSTRGAKILVIDDDRDCVSVSGSGFSETMRPMRK